MIKKAVKFFGFFAAGIAGGILGVQIWLYFFPPQQSVYITERQEIIIRENDALENAIEKSEKMAIGVRTVTSTGKVLEGSGLIITADGLAVTLADLVPQGSNFTFYVQGQPVAFQILKRDLKENLALIKLEKNNLPTASFADANEVKLGERVFLTGLIFENKIPKTEVNEGIVRSFDQNYIQTNIFEKSNMKGSVLFDIKGNVLGINIVDGEGRIICILAKKIKEFSGL